MSRPSSRRHRPAPALLVPLVLVAAACGGSAGAGGSDLRQDVKDAEALLRATAPALSRGQGVLWQGLLGQVDRCDGTLPPASFSAGGDIREGAPTAAAARTALRRAGLAPVSKDGDLVVRRGRATMTYRVVPVRGSSSGIGRYSIDTPCTYTGRSTYDALKKRGTTDYGAQLDLPR